MARAAACMPKLQHMTLGIHKVAATIWSGQLQNHVVLAEIRLYRRCGWVHGPV